MGFIGVSFQAESLEVIEVGFCDSLEAIHKIVFGGLLNFCCFCRYGRSFGSYLFAEIKVLPCFAPVVRFANSEWPMFVANM
jgi:hypothetical protein